MKTLAAIALFGFTQLASISNDTGIKTQSASKIGGRAHHTRIEQRAVAKESAQAAREQQKAQLHDAQIQARTQAVTTVRQELQQSIQDAKIQAREQLRKVVDEERTLIRTGM